MILCDTNILIEFYKGNSTIINELHKIGLPDLAVSIVTTGELFYGARDKLELAKMQKHLSLMKQIPLDEEISSRFLALLNVHYEINSFIKIGLVFITARARWLRWFFSSMESSAIVFPSSDSRKIGS